VFYLFVSFCFFLCYLSFLLPFFLCSPKLTIRY
jgi:hypothetical protein